MHKRLSEIFFFKFLELHYILLVSGHSLYPSLIFKIHSKQIFETYVFTPQNFFILLCLSFHKTVIFDN